MSTSKFSTEPKIIFTRVTCPFCKNPTGPSSTCYLSNEHKNIQITKDGSVLSLFNEGCAFRQDSLWYIDINYPLSEPLVERLSIISGINKFIIVNPYRGQIGISPAFNESEVKRNVIASFKTFIKEMLVTEQNVNGKKPFKPLILCIKLPNGNIFENRCETDEEYCLVKNLFSETQEKIPGTEIFEKA